VKNLKRSLHIPGRKAMRQAFAGTLLALGLAMPVMAQDQGDTPLRIVTFGAGPLGGAYYATAKAICDAHNLRSAGMQRCSPDPTPGSLYNLTAIRRGELDFAIVQSDLQREAVFFERLGLRQLNSAELNSVISLYSEALTILARRDAQVRTFADLRGLSVDRGPANSGRRPTVERMFATLGFSEADFENLSGLTASVALDELCAGRLDAVILVIGHPNATVARALENCDVVLVGATGPSLSDDLAENPDFVPGMIPAASYPQMEVDVPTVSVLATVLTREDIPADLVSDFTRTLLALRDDLPQAASLDASGQWWSAGLTARLHPGARSVLEERGLALPAADDQ